MTKNVLIFTVLVMTFRTSGVPREPIFNNFLSQFAYRGYSLRRVEVHYRNLGRVPGIVYPTAWSVPIFMGVPLSPSSRHIGNSPVFEVGICGWTCPNLDEGDRWPDVWSHVVAPGRHGYDRAHPKFISGRTLQNIFRRGHQVTRLSKQAVSTCRIQLHT